MAHLLIVEDQPELASLVEATARLRGHSATAVHTGTDAIAALDDETQRYEAAVVDLFLPDVRGSEVLRALSRKSIPAFAMSGVYKGDRFAREAVEEHGARAFFEKPFELNELLDAIETVVGKPQAPVPNLDDEPLVIDEVEEEELPRNRTRRLSIARIGPIEEGTVPRVLNACYQARHTGELRLKQGQVLKVVYFEAGQPVYAASNVAQERFARFCARKGVLSDMDLSAVTALSRDENVRTGDAMVRLGVITAEQRRALITEQIKDII